VIINLVFELEIKYFIGPIDFVSNEYLQKILGIKRAKNTQNISKF
tara:strand:- start:516 stop:650 length:135 start_codon:yes stop_codon:yes gene_type:complete